MADKVLSVRIEGDLHRKLRVKLAQEDRSFQEVAEALTRAYVEGELSEETAKRVLGGGG